MVSICVNYRTSKRHVPTCWRALPFTPMQSRHDLLTHSTAQRVTAVHKASPVSHPDRHHQSTTHLGAPPHPSRRTKPRCVPCTL